MLIDINQYTVVVLINVNRYFTAKLTYFVQPRLCRPTFYTDLIIMTYKLL